MNPGLISVGGHGSLSLLQCLGTEDLATCYANVQLMSFQESRIGLRSRCRRIRHCKSQLSADVRHRRYVLRGCPRFSAEIGFSTRCQSPNTDDLWPGVHHTRSRRSWIGRMDHTGPLRPFSSMSLYWLTHLQGPLLMQAVSASSQDS